MSYDSYKAKFCRYCDVLLPEPFLELGAMPLANNLITQEEMDHEEFKCPLSLTFCTNCFLVQLTHVVPPEKMFSHYLYVSSTTQTFRDHFAQYAKTLAQKIGVKKNKPLAVDIGSNDGLLVSCYMKEGMNAIGIDPAKNLADEANQKGFRTLNRFFDSSCVKDVISEFGKAHVVSGNNVFAHIDKIQEVCKNVHELLADNGIFVIEFPYLVTMLETLVFDMIYHEHVSYIGVLSLSYLLKRFGFKIFDIQKVSSHGGSLRVFIQKQSGPYREEKIVDDLMRQEKQKGCDKKSVYDRFAEQVRLEKKLFMDRICSINESGKRIVGYGAPAKASTICNFYELHPQEIDYVVDDNPLKQGYLIPGARIPIVPSATLQSDPPEYVILFAWNFAKEILAKLGFLREQGVQFLVPLIGPEGLYAASVPSNNPFLV